MPRSALRRPRPVSRLERWAAAGLSAGCLGLLGVSAWLSPASEGHGTHEQLGMPACMWAATLGKPCPTCGMTTAFAHAGHAEFVASFLTQPMGFVLAIGAAVGFWGTAHVAATGSRLGVFAGRLVGRRLLLAASVLLLAAWAYKYLTWTSGAGS